MRRYPLLQPFRHLPVPVSETLSLGSGAGYGTLLFSLWDAGRYGKHPNASALARCASGAHGPNVTWCMHKHSFPLSANCHRHCLDCGLHPGAPRWSSGRCRLAVPF